MEKKIKPEKYLIWDKGTQELNTDYLDAISTKPLFDFLPLITVTNHAHCLLTDSFQIVTLKAQ